MLTKLQTKLFVKILLAFIQLSLGYGLIYLFMGQHLADDLGDLDKFRLASLPTMAISGLNRFAGTGEIVRVQGKITLTPPLTGPNGEKLAYKAVTQTDDDDHSHVDDEWWIPTTFHITDGKTKIPVIIKRTAPDPYYLTERVKGYIRNNQIAPEVAAQMGADFKELKPINNDTIRVYTVAQNTPVTVYGVVERRDGNIVLRPPQRKILGKTTGRLILSTLPPSELIGRLRLEGYLAIFMGCGLALPLLIVIIVMIWIRRQEIKAGSSSL